MNKVLYTGKMKLDRNNVALVQVINKGMLSWQVMTSRDADILSLSIEAMQRSHEYTRLSEEDD